MPLIISSKTGRGLLAIISTVVLLRIMFVLVPHPSWTEVSNLHDPHLHEPPLKTYRETLATVLPKDNFTSSRTLFPQEVTGDGESAIYVISLARRHDRRETLTKIAAALELDFTFVDATDAQDTSPGGDAELVEHLYKRVGWQRWDRINEREARQKELRPKDYDDKSDARFVLNAFPFEWSDEAKQAVKAVKERRDGETEVERPRTWSGADFWDTHVPGAEDWAARNPMERWVPASGQEWKTNIHTTEGTNTLRKRTNLTMAQVACWHSHVVAIREIVQRNLSAALILEDDIDIEFDIQQIVHTQLPHVPSNWDILFLGHCNSNEHKYNPLPSAPRFRKSASPLCLHGYAVSRKGARKLLKFLRSPDFAYGRPVDWVPLDLLRMGLLTSYSAFPPLIVQRKEDWSDIEGKVGFKQSWKEIEGELEDSTMMRIRIFDMMHGTSQTDIENDTSDRPTSTPTHIPPQGHKHHHHEGHH